MGPKLTALVVAVIWAGALVGAPAAQESRAPVEQEQEQKQEPAQQPLPEPELPPSARKAERLVERTLEALGGKDFLQVQTIKRKGRLYNFNRGQLANPGSKFVDYVKFPNMERLELGDDGKIVYLNNHDEGWELDKQGVRAMSPEGIENFLDATKWDFDYLFRFHIPEGRLSYYYQGRQFVDNRRAHLIEMVHEDNTSVTVVIDARTYLPMQIRHRERHAVTGDWVDVVDFFGKYITVQGVGTWMQFTRHRNGLRSFEVHVKEVEYNTSVPDRFFTRASLEEHWREVK